MKALTTQPSSATASTNLVPVVNYSAGAYTLTGLIIGQTYCWVKGANDTNCVVDANVKLLATGVFTATATSVTLNGSGTSAVTAIVTYTVNLYPCAITPTQPARQVTVGQFPVSNPNWSRLLQISDQCIFVKRGTYGVAIALTDVVNMALSQEPNLTWTPPVLLLDTANATCAATAYATGTLTWDNSAGPSNGDTVVIGIKTYTFRTALTPLEGEVLLNGGGDAALLNLIRAINHTGTPGTDYSCAAANTQVSAASSVTSHAFAVTALVEGVASNLIGTTETSAHLAWSHTTLTGGTVAATTFSITAGSEYVLTYQWQYSVDGVAWSNCTGTVNGCAYTNSTTATLTCTPTTAGQTGYFHRCVITDNAGSFGLTNGVTNSSESILTIP